MSYLAFDAGHLAGVGGDRIGQWARWGHIRASVSAGEPHVYAFDDVAEAIAVHVLLDRGIGLPAIRRAVDALGGPAGWPLSRGGLHVVHGRLAVERGGVLVDLESGGEQEVLPLDGRVDAL
ncbi:MAG: helix-turn-helix domain-containing protein, partial [Actinomycetota bacterium]|nr:helix-turn-helix domain-containing protein [Actinomycetota bacterium]